MFIVLNVWQRYNKKINHQTKFDIFIIMDANKFISQHIFNGIIDLEVFESD